MRCRVSSFVRGAGSTCLFRPFFVLPFRPLLVLLVVVALLAPVLLAEGDVLSAEFSGEACREVQMWGRQGRIAGSRPIFCLRVTFASLLQDILRGRADSSFITRRSNCHSLLCGAFPALPCIFLARLGSLQTV